MSSTREMWRNIRAVEYTWAKNRAYTFNAPLPRSGLHLNCALEHRNWHSKMQRACTCISRVDFQKCAIYAVSRFLTKFNTLGMAPRNDWLEQLTSRHRVDDSKSRPVCRDFAAHVSFVLPAHPFWSSSSRLPDSWLQTPTGCRLSPPLTSLFHTHTLRFSTFTRFRLHILALFGCNSISYYSSALL